MGVEERLSLDAVSEHTLIAVEHRHRYAFAMPACAGKRVVDLCCGVGYGSEMLAAVAESVVGVDRDAAAIDTAQATVGARTSARFVAADALDHLRRLEPADVDVIVCFEGLEHLPEVAKVADQLVRLVRGGAGLIASVPNSATFEEDNEYHLTDFDLPAARALFSGLPDAVFAYQNHAEGSLIRGEEAPAVQVEVQLDGEQDLDWANHFLVLAGVDHETLLSSAKAAVHVAIAPVNHRYMRGLERANRSLQAANAQLARERLGLGAAGGAAALLRREDDLAELRAQLNDARERLGAAETEAAALNAERAEYRRAYVAVRSSRLTNLAARIAGHRFER
jgi:SAM-dependent methyltransferase